MADAGIVRNRAKIAAAVRNARAAQELPGGPVGAAVVASRRPAARPRPATLADVPATSPESVAMAKELKRRGFVFVGPTTAYALMQATGMVDDHVADCFRAQPRCRAREGLMLDGSRSYGIIGSQTHSIDGRRTAFLPRQAAVRPAKEARMAAMKPRTGEGPLEVTKEGRGLVMRVPLEGGGRLVVELSPDEAAALSEALKGATS